MTARENEVATYLELDGPLGTLAPGGVYADSEFPDLGITNATNAPDIWAGGVFQTTVIVRQRGRIPDYAAFDEAEQVVSSRQVVEVYAYARLGQEAAIEQILDRVYVLMTDPNHPFDKAWPVTQQPDSLPGLTPALELPQVMHDRDDYLFRSLRKP